MHDVIFQSKDLMGFHCCFFDEGRTFKDGFKNGQILHKMNLTIKKSINAGGSKCPCVLNPSFKKLSVLASIQCRAVLTEHVFRREP